MGKYIVCCKSNFSGMRSICQDKNGNVLYFNTKEKAEEYAEKYRTVNYHYWVEEA